MQIHLTLQVKRAQMSCPVSAADNTLTKQWVTLLSDVPLCCCCCLSLQVVSYHACVCGLFHSYMWIHCVSVLSMPSECCVCIVVCGFIITFPLQACLFVLLPAPRTSTLANKTTHCNVKAQYLYAQYFCVLTVCALLCVHMPYCRSNQLAAINTGVKLIAVLCDNHLSKAQGSGVRGATKVRG